MRWVRVTSVSAVAGAASGGVCVKVIDRAPQMAAVDAKFTSLPRIRVAVVGVGCGRAEPLLTARSEAELSCQEAPS